MVIAALRKMVGDDVVEIDKNWESEIQGEWSGEVKGESGKESGAADGSSME